MTESRQDLGKYDTFSSAIPLIHYKTLYPALAKLGDDAWYESLKANLAKFIRLLEPTKKPWRPLFFDIEITQLTPEKLLGSLRPSNWPFQLSTAETRSLSEFIMELNRLIRVLNNHDMAIEQINYFSHVVNSGTKSQLLKELNEKSDELQWLFSKELWKTFKREPKESKLSAYEASRKKVVTYLKRYISRLNTEEDKATKKLSWPYGMDDLLLLEFIGDLNAFTDRLNIKPINSLYITMPNTRDRFLAELKQKLKVVEGLLPSEKKYESKKWNPPTKEELYQKLNTFIEYINDELKTGSKETSTTSWPYGKKHEELLDLVNALNDFTTTSKLEELGIKPLIIDDFISVPNTSMKFLTLLKQRRNILAQCFCFDIEDTDTLPVVTTLKKAERKR